MLDVAQVLHLWLIFEYMWRKEQERKDSKQRDVRPMFPAYQSISIDGGQTTGNVDSDCCIPHVASICPDIPIGIRLSFHTSPAPAVYVQRNHPLVCLKVTGRQHETRAEGRLDGLRVARWRGCVAICLLHPLVNL